MHPFELNAVDHVAIRIKDMEVSIEWYGKALGLKKVLPKAWEPFPVFMMNKKFGVALFPANIDDEEIPSYSKNVKIDHFAFSVTNENFIKAQNHLKQIEIDFDFQDHTYFHSIYMNDPDGHKVELTTLVVGDEFYDF